MSETGAPKLPSRRTPEVLVPLVGLLFTSAYLLYAVPTVPPSITLILAVFAVIFLATAFLVWRRSRVGFGVAIAMSAIFLANFASTITSDIGNPSDLTIFVPLVTIIPALVATIAYSALGIREVWPKAGGPKPRRMIPLSSFIALVVIGFVVGALLVGAASGATETRLLANAGKSSNIVIVQGAGTEGNPGGYFSPVTYTVTVGQTVTWVNGDGATHTVTSSSVPPGAISFDSGNLPPGAQYSVTFTIPGTYEYYCTIHPWMKGTIVVVSG